MGTMNRMRENTGIVLWILVISFGLLWVLQDSGVFDTMGTDPLGKVIVVDGDVITREEYSQQLEYQLEQIRQITNATIEPERLEMERERAFNVLVDDRLSRREMDRLGVAVSDREIQELIIGENPHQIIQANFAGQDGEIDRDLLQSVIASPEQEATWIQIEEFLRQDRRRTKFNALLGATVRVSDGDVQEQWMRQAQTVDVDYFVLAYADVADSLVELTDREVERYYNEHEGEYQRERRYSLELASLSKLPSQEDTLAIVREAEQLRGGFETAEDDSLYLATVGLESDPSDAFLGPADMSAALAETLFGGETALEVGQVIGPLPVGATIQVVKVVDVRDAEETNVRARHILIMADRGDEEAVAAARERIQAIEARLDSGELFGVVAREVSEDPGSAARMGDLGWFGDGTMVAEFQEAAFGATVGERVGPIQTQFGLHLIETTARAEQEVQLSRLQIPMEASVATLNAINDRLLDLQYFGDESGNFGAEAERLGVNVQTLDMQADQIAIPGVGTSIALRTFLDTADESDISPIIELNQQAIMVHVVAIEEAGTRPLEDVELIVRTQAFLEKKRAYQRERMAEAYADGGFDGLVQALAQQPRTVSALNLGSPVVPGLGRDMTFVGTAFALNPGVDSGVIEGESGVFVLRPSARSLPAPLDDAELQGRLTSQTSQRESAVVDQWIAYLREVADIEDLRTDLLPQQAARF